MLRRKGQWGWPYKDTSKIWTSKLCTFLKVSNNTLKNVDHILGHKENLSFKEQQKYKHDYKGLKLEIKFSKKSWKKSKSPLSDN